MFIQLKLKMLQRQYYIISQDCNAFGYYSNSTFEKVVMLIQVCFSLCICKKERKKPSTVQLL